MTQKGTLDVLGELDKVSLQHIKINALVIGKWGSFTYPLSISQV